VFGVQPPAGRGQSVAPAGVPAAAVPAYQTAHPERGFMYQQGGTMAAPIVRPGGIGGTSGFVKSPNFRMDLRAMDVGDVDGDGNDEYVLADTQKVSIYRRAENRYTLAGQYEIPHRYRIHGVTIGDLNNNGRGEIYVSAADTKEPRSTVLEWNGKEFAPLFTEQPWYLRALSLPGQGMILAGQKSAVDGPLMPGIHRLEPKGSSLLVQAEKLPVPDMVNLFDFAVADLDGDGASEVIAIDQYDHLLVRRQSGKILYQSDDYYGGTTRFIGGQEAMGMADKATIEDLGRVYVPSRLVIADVNRDGLPDVLINKNLSSSSRVFRNAKSYPSGEIHALTWNGIALTELWRTRKIDGYISDYQLNPDKDGSGGTLAVGIVLRGGVVDSLADGESTVLSYRLDFVADAEKNGDSPAKQ
ncbi:MAG: VCBS repeat-containing protein, partial [Desulfobulbaceae bacterium]|nr:VCBS repeat-containing protein [Desulfobulbaceae bacterium]